MDRRLHATQEAFGLLDRRPRIAAVEQERRT
jgi:hypothetical protein